MQSIKKNVNDYGIRWTSDETVVKCEDNHNHDLP